MTDSVSNYETKDYVIPIHTSDNKTLYFSKNALINKCEMVRMLENNKQLDELNLPFDSHTIEVFLTFLDTEKIDNVKNFCLVADYFRYDNGDGLFSSKESVINTICAVIIHPSYYYSFVMFYKYIRIDNLIPQNLTDESIEELFLKIRPIHHPQINSDIHISIDWLDFIEMFDAPQLLVDKYNQLFCDFVKLYKIYDEASKEIRQLTLDPYKLIEFLRFNKDRVLSLINGCMEPADQIDEFLGKYQYEYKTLHDIIAIRGLRDQLDRYDV